MNDKPRESAPAKSTSLEEILCRMNEVEGFRVSMLTSTEGLPIAAVPANYDSDFAAAIVALIQRTSNDARSQLGMADVDEVTIRACDGIRLVCRHIVAGRDRLILAVMVPPDCPYRRVTSQAVKEIRELLS